MDNFNNVEIFLRLNGRLPEKSTDTVGIDEFKKYCDMVMQGTKCPRGRVYCMDGLWNYSWEKFKEAEANQP